MPIALTQTKPSGQNFDQPARAPQLLTWRRTPPTEDAATFETLRNARAAVARRHSHACELEQHCFTLQRDNCDESALVCDTSSGRSVRGAFHRPLLTPRIAEVDADRNARRGTLNGNSFDSASLLITIEDGGEQIEHAEKSRLDDPASFARPLRVRNLFVEVCLPAVLAAPSLWLVRTAHPRFDRPAVEGMTRVDVQVFFFSRTLSSL